MKIGFIGAGKVGFSLGRYFKENGVFITGYYSKTLASAKQAGEFTDSDFFENPQELIKKSDIIFITVPDGKIKEVWDSIKGDNLRGKIFCHCSGVLSSRVFDEAQKYGVYAYSLHMFFAVSDKLTSYRSLKHTVFTLEGNPKYIEQLKEIISHMGNTVEIISAENKEKYHASAVIGSNFVVALAELSVSLLKECGFSEDSAFKAVVPLMTGNTANIERQGIVSSLTGPVERNDIETVKKHIKCLDEENKKIYISLSKILIGIAEKKHPEIDYGTLKKELEI